MDALDLRILASLDADARRPFADVARELNVSQPTVAERVRRLEERGILRGTMLCLDHAKLGFAITAFVRIRTTSKDERMLAEAAAEIPQILEMHSVTGDDCVIARVVARSVDELAGTIERLTQFGQSSTSIVLRTPIRLRNPLPAMAGVQERPAVARLSATVRRR